ncbi:MAG: SDR family oxidoreductase [Gammaproteobacteria bacterium]|nr:SDR family oxidoreductase [Gammaproteobacteria bacterium]
MNLELENKVAIVTASSKGLGFATAKQLAAEGAKVIICSSSQDNINQAVTKITDKVGKQAKVTGMAVNLSETDCLHEFINTVAEKHGGIDILITNTAGPKAGLFDDISSEDLTAAYQKLLLPTFTLIKAATPHLRKSETASILTVTSLSLKQPISGLLLSNIFRPAIGGLTKTLSQELGPDGIRINSILPGWTSTDRTIELLGGDKNNQRTTELKNKIPLKRLATPEEFANVATFLVSPAASYINGVMLPVDGGLYTGLI